MSCGVDHTRCLICSTRSTRLIGPWRIRVLPAAHDRILGWLPFRGTRSQLGTCPAKASDWRLGEPMAFLIEANSKRIYVDSGGTPEVLPPAQIAPVDLAILGWLYPTAENDFALPSTGSAQGMFWPLIRMTSLPRSNLLAAEQSDERSSLTVVSLACLASAADQRGRCLGGNFYDRGLTECWRLGFQPDSADMLRACRVRDGRRLRIPVFRDRQDAYLPIPSPPAS
jgi:hypothetical protein